VAATGCPLVELTGGEPLAQKRSFDLVRVLCERGLTVLIETSGAVDIAPCDPRAIRILDIKTPGSGESERNLWQNLGDLRARDEVKFVLTDRADYDWAKAKIAEHRLAERVREGRLGAILLSAAWEQPKGMEIAGCAGLSPRSLAEWIVADRLPVRMQTRARFGVQPQERSCLVSRSMAKCTTCRPIRKPLCCTCCKTSCCSKAPNTVVAWANAALARCTSMAKPFARASCRWAQCAAR
jgi:organic radical activating enzyme